MRKRTNKKFCLEFHHSYFIVALGFVLTGNYLNLIIFTSLIFIHEFGHFFIATLFHFKVDKIIIYPFGGITKINEIINLNIEQELLVAVAGVISQFLFYLFICFLHHISLIREYAMILYTLYNGQMIFFNLLPIYPLDGSRILNLIFSCFLPYNISNFITIIISFICIIVLICLNIYSYNYSNIMMYFLLFYHLVKFFHNRRYIYYRFLLERYLYSFSYPKHKIISDYHYMYKNKKHLFLIDNTIKSEKEVLSKVFS